jgi:hypothetical protein
MTPASGAERRVVLHVGLYKTGTSFLQNLMRQNRRPLRRAGVYVPAGVRKMLFAFHDLMPWDSELARDPRVPGAWQRLADEVMDSRLSTAVISEERLSVAGARQVRRVVSSFGDAEVHVVVTVRDLTRVVASHWQEDVKSGATWTLDEYVARLRDPQAAGEPPARGFWTHEDVTEVLRTWRAVVPPERLHVITVPPSGSAPDLLVSRFASVVGFDLDDVPKRDLWGNENIGAVGAELMRRLNERLDGRLSGRVYRQGVKWPLSRRLAALPDRRQTPLDAEQTAWAAATSQRFADAIRDGGYDVVGDLADLTARPADGAGAAEAPEIDDSALLDVALEGLAGLAELHGEAMAKADLERGASRPQVTTSRRARARTLLWSWAYSTGRAASRVAGRTGPGRRAQVAFLRRRRGR